MAIMISIIGSNKQQNPLIFNARERGYETHTFSWHDGGEIGRESSDHFYPISANSKEEILSKCREIGVEAVASIGSDVSALAAAYVAESMGLAGNSYEAVKRATNKLRTRRLLAEIGIDQPRFAEIGDAVSFDVLKELKYPLIVKPSDRSGSRGIRVIQSESEFFSAINEARDLSFERKAIVEEYVSGTTYSCECVSVNGEHKIIGYTKREVALINARPCEYKHLQPAILPFSVLRRLETEIGKIFDALGIRSGASSVEFIVDGDNRVYFGEVSPYLYGDYIGTHLVPTVYGVDMTGIVLDIATGGEVKLSVTKTGTSAAVEFEYSSTDGVRHVHTVTQYADKEYGGCSALKLNGARAFYSESEHTVALSSEYSAFRYALELIGSKRIHIPHYASPIWGKIAEQLEMECVYYHIGTDFLPTDLNATDNDTVFLINYHGICSEGLKQFTKGTRIIDNSMAFCEEPIMEVGVYNIYSCRKFFAVADGAYLISQSISDENRKTLPRDVSYKRAAVLLKSLELGESSAYKDMQTNEQELAKKYCCMSALTECMLSAVDYASEDAARTRNFTLLHESLKKYNLLAMDKLPAHAPQFYPLLVNADIRNYLISKKIFIPLMWRRTLSAEFNGLPEKQLSEGLVCLPVSPKYSEKDMEYIAQTVIASIT